MVDLEVGLIVNFTYPSKEGFGEWRECHIEKIGGTYIQGWDSTRKGYRTFSFDKMMMVDNGELHPSLRMDYTPLHVMV